jgi:hypothetical protein
MPRFFGKKRTAAPAPAPAPLVPREPFHLASERVTFMVGLTARAAIEAHLGPAVEYPAPGWRTWAVAGLRGQPWVLSAIYRDAILIGVEHYLSKTDNLPRHTPPANGVYRLQPGDIGIGNRIEALPGRFTAVPGNAGGVHSIVFEHAYQARWQHGLAIVSGNDGRIERIAIYADGAMPTIG